MKKLFFGGLILASMIIGSLSVFAAEGDDQVHNSKLLDPQFNEWCDDPGNSCLAGTEIK